MYLTILSQGVSNMRAICLTIALVLGTALAFAQGKPAQGKDAQAIDTACASDAGTASCGSEQVGTGLLKCLWAYKKAHKKEFNFSPGCKAAMKQASQDHKE
jgi:hypothetical protein